MQKKINYGAVEEAVADSTQNVYQSLLGTKSIDNYSEFHDEAIKIIKSTRKNNRARNIALAFFAAICTGTIIHVLTAMSSGKNIVSDVVSWGSSNAALFKHSGIIYSNAQDPCLATATNIPFPAIDRSMYSNVSVASIVDPNLFHPSLRYSPSNTEVKKDRPLLKVPFPTGAFWTNLVMEPTPELSLSFPVMAYPYGYKWSPSLLQISYPPIRRLTDNISVRDIFNPDLTLSIIEKVSRRYIMKFDPMSITLRYIIGENENSNFFETYLVQGNPYVTVKFQDVTPVFTALSTFQRITCPATLDSIKETSDVDPAEAKQGMKDRISRPDTRSLVSSELCHQVETDNTETTLSGTRFLISTNENLTWMVFTSSSITLTLNSIGRRTITSSSPFTGIIRLVLLPPPNMNVQKKESFTFHFDSFPITSSQGVKKLIEYSNIYPIGSEVSWKTSETSLAAENASGDIATISFNFETGSMNSPSGSLDSMKDDLLMLALPHHTQLLKSNSMLTDFDISFECIKGRMTPVLGRKWSYEEQLTDIGFDEPASLEAISKLDSDMKQSLISQVKDDLTKVLPTLDENVYGYGKQIARLAQLAYISNVLKSIGIPSDIPETATTLLHDHLTAFLNDDGNDKLLYDVNFGGLISKDGLNNSLADFGNGWYNDHHFHYGYILYASAILGKLNTTFVSEYGKTVDAFLYDVSYITNGDSSTTSDVFFPFSRYKSWYDSHSFASGLFAHVTGKSQESSSEAINCYYGAYLWSLIRFGTEDRMGFVDFTRLLLGTEIRGAKTYWHIDGSTNSYDGDFSRNYMVGNVGMFDLTLTTWFGTKQLYVHMINFMPVTAITRLLFDKTYVEKEFNSVIAPIYKSIPSAWKGYAICDRAIIDPSEAWNDAKKVKSIELDAGLSKSQLLYWISTTEGFSEPTTETIDEGKSGGEPKTPSECSANAGCANLEGNCCPTQEGFMLGCCDAVIVTTCGANKGCADLGLIEGFCCPTPEGVYLDCCTNQE